MSTTLARTWQHPQTAAGPRERLQSRPPDAAAVRPRHPPGPPGAAIGHVLAAHRPPHVLPEALDDHPRASGARPTSTARPVFSFGAGDSMLMRWTSTTGC